MKIFVLNGFRACWLGRNGQTKGTFQADFAGSGMCQCERFRRKLHVSWPCCSWNSKVPIFAFELLETDVFEESSQPCQEPHLSNSSAHESRGKCSKCLPIPGFVCCFSAVGLTKNASHFFQAPLCPEGIWSHLELGQFGFPRDRWNTGRLGSPLLPSFAAADSKAESSMFNAALWRGAKFQPYLLMVQKSQGQPPGMYKEACK